MTVANLYSSASTNSLEIGPSKSENLSGQTATKTHLEQKARLLLELHPHFRGRHESVQCKVINRSLCLAGFLPSYYLKQLAQEAIRELEAVIPIDNRIVVASPLGEVIERVPNAGDKRDDVSIIRKPR